MYLEYHELLKKYKDSDRRYNESLEEKSKLILSVLPKASQYKETVTSGGNSASPDWKLINYTSNIDEVDKLINQSRNTRDMLNYELKKLEFKLKVSADVLDKIYYYKWIKKLSPYKFNRIIGYSIRQTYYYIEEIEKNIYKNVNIAQNCTNDMVK